MKHYTRALALAGLALGSVTAHATEGGVSVYPNGTENYMAGRISAGFNRIMPVLPDLAQELVTLELLWAVLPAGHPLAAEDSLSLEQLATQPFVLFPNAGRPNFVDRVIRIFGDRGLDIAVAQEIGDTVTGMALVAHGFGVTLVPESVTRAIALRNTVYRPLSDAPHAQIDLSCIYRADDGSPQLHALLALIRVQRATRSAARPDAAATCQPLGH